MYVLRRDDHVRFTTDYSERMLNDPAGIAEELCDSAEAKGVEFDTIVGRGSSGMLVVPLVASILGKKWLIVRKDEEVESSHDSEARWLGDLGKRWVFLDDFCSSGRTFRSVRDGVQEAAERAEFDTELVGYFEYEDRSYETSRVLTLWNENTRPGFNDKYWDDIPGYFVKKSAEASKVREAVRLSYDDTEADGPRNPNCGVGEPGCDCLIPTPMEVALDELIDNALPVIRTYADTSLIGSRYGMRYNELNT